MAQNQESVHLDRGVNYQSSFTLGVLGTRIPERVQTLLHDALDLDEPQGWRNQISDGGELTAK